MIRNTNRRKKSREYPQLENEFLKGSFPPEVLADLRTILNIIGKQPVIVRSSSQLEDSFGHLLRREIYQRVLPNQAAERKPDALTRAIARAYASTFSTGSAFIQA